MLRERSNTIGTIDRSGASHPEVVRRRRSVMALKAISGCATSSWSTAINETRNRPEATQAPAFEVDAAESTPSDGARLLLARRVNPRLPGTQGLAHKREASDTRYIMPALPSAPVCGGAVFIASVTVRLCFVPAAVAQ